MSTSQQPARPYIGGQAVLEGVMMRAPTSFAIAVRRRDGSILIRERAMKSERSGLGKWPLARGIATLVESLKLGAESLRFSAEQYERDLVQAEEAEKRASAATSMLTALGVAVLAMTTRDAGEPSIAGDTKKKSPMGLMLALVILLFVALPQGAAAGVNRVLHLGLDVQSPGFQAITGAFKLAIVVGYMMLIRRIPEIRRMFQYHGAEHKTISTYEAKEPLTVASARTKTTLHPRCGTTFLVMVALVSILVFTAVGAFLPKIDSGSAIVNNVVFFFEKLPFLPVIVAVTFEIQRVFARWCTTGPLRVLLWPGFLVQKITTIEPDDDQLEIALASLRATLFREERGEGDERGEAAANDVAFESYDELARASRLRAA